MAVYSVSLIHSGATDAAFRLVVDAIIDGIVALGWVQTADTGQINPATVTAPAGVSTKQGYAIFRMDDALQATKPCFLRIDFGSGASAASAPGYWFTIGTGSDGAGAITGALVTDQIVSASQNTLAVTAIFSGNAGRMTVSPHCYGTNATSTNCGIWWNLERTLDAAGAPTSTGLTFSHSATNGTLFRCRHIDWVAGAATQETNLPMLVPLFGAASSGTVYYPASCLPMKAGGIPDNAQMGILGIFPSVVAEGVTVTIPLYGANRRFIAASSLTIASATMAGRTAAALMTLLFNYEA